MSVNLDQIEFYHGPSRPPPYTNAKSVPPDHVRVPSCFQQAFPAGFGFRPGPWEVPLGQSPPLAGTTHEWNIFDFEINNVYGPTLPEMRKDVEPSMPTAMPAARDTLLDRGSSALAFADPVTLADSAKTIPCPAGPDSLEQISPDMRGKNLQDAVHNNEEVETFRLPCVPYVTAPVPAPEQANRARALSSLSVVGDSQQESAKRKLSPTGPSDSLHPEDPKNDAEPGQISDLGENPCSTANDAPERAKDSGTTEDKPLPSRPSAPPTLRSSPECSRIRTTRSSDVPVRYPSIAVIVPSPSWKQAAARTSTRAAAALCKQRLRSGRNTCNHQDENTTLYDTKQPCQKRKKRRPLIVPFSDTSVSSIPVSSHCPGAIQGVRGSALLTVESDSGLKPAYFFTFVPDPSPMLSGPHAEVIPEKPRYTSDENALLVRLKEKEAMSWPEITTHFPGRNMSSLQVHYSTKLRHKARSRSGKPRRHG